MSSIERLVREQAQTIKTLKGENERLSQQYASALEINIKLQKQRERLEDKVILALRGIETAEKDIVRKERDQAMYNARVLAHAWEHDSNPPQRVVKESLNYSINPGKD